MDTKEQHKGLEVVATIPTPWMERNGGAFVLCSQNHLALGDEVVYGGIGVPAALAAKAKAYRWLPHEHRWSYTSSPGIAGGVCLKTSCATFRRSRPLSRFLSAYQLLRLFFHLISDFTGVPVPSIYKPLLLRLGQYKVGSFKKRWMTLLRIMEANQSISNGSG
ncbi:hypothetical protein GE061_000386 [Apolygus lucorum]|uniref:Uncharacterized protein n=1 Tax=Apolygus lucorum TaxID=248454 RepID=A0A8S9Y5P6_APOLU|nr:hypothetical protein GE061_000386 [Apolygus lucorum]